MSERPMFAKRATGFKTVAVEYTCDDAFPGVGEYVPNQTFSEVILGGPGAGKSSFMINQLITRGAYRNTFESIIYVCPPESKASIRKIPGKYTPECYYYETLHDNIPEINAIIEDTRVGRKNRNRTLLILDDVQGELKTGEVQAWFIERQIKRRHHRLSTMILCQNYIMVPSPVRTNLSCIVLMHTDAQKELDLISKEFSTFDRKTLGYICKHNLRDPHDFVILNRTTRAISCGEAHGATTDFYMLDPV